METACVDLKMGKIRFASFGLQRVGAIRCRRERDYLIFHHAVASWGRGGGLSLVPKQSCMSFTGEGGSYAVRCCVVCHTGFFQMLLGDSTSVLLLGGKCQSAVRCGSVEGALF